MSALVTDLYQLTMAAGYWEAGKARDRATFELFVRRLPKYRNYVLAAGLQQAIDYLLALRFTREEIAYLRGLPQFRAVHADFFGMLAEFRFTGDVFAVREGTPLFAGEPFLTIRAPLIEAQIPETFLLATVGFQSMIATKAARVVKAATGRTVVEFGTRRAHSPEAGVLAGRAAYLAGCIGTSNVATGFRYGVPVFGTAAHSWVLSFANEREAQARLQQLLGENTAYLIDTYDTLEGAREAASLGRPLWGVRLDSGNLVELAPAVRRILDEAGLHDAKIMATGDLNEYKIHELVAAGVPIDSFGVGTDLATSADSPSLGVIYKMVELEGVEGHRYTAKFSDGKATWPGSKQVFRYPGRDLIGRSTECPERGEPCAALLHPVVRDGQLVEPLPSLEESRAYAAKAIAALPAPCQSLYDHEDPYRVEYSADMMSLAETVRRGLARVSVEQRTGE